MTNPKHTDTNRSGDLVERLQERAAKVREWMISSQRVVDLLAPEMEKFNKREAPWDTYTVRMSVDHQSSIRKQTKEVEEYEQAADRIKALEAEIERLRAAISWAEDADPVLADAIRNRAGLGEKRDLPECFGSIEATHPQSRAENCCDDCPVEGLCRAALGEK